MLVSVSIAVLLTTMFMFRFRTRHPGWGIGYFLVIGGVELGIHHFLLPPNALPPEVALVCFPLAFLFFVLTGVVRKLEDQAAATPRLG